MLTIEERLVALIEDHGLAAVEFPGGQILATSTAVYRDGTVAEVCDILPANYSAVRAWLGY